MGEIFRTISETPRGMVTVTGPTGSGKSTTLAAMLDYINNTRYQHILTVEDPIEFVHESKKCLVNQREVHRDTLGFNEALRSALRRTRILSSSVRCGIWRPFAWHSRRQKPVIWFWYPAYLLCCENN